MSHVITIHSDLSKGKINRNIYGHFSEHLGRAFMRAYGLERIHRFRIRRDPQ